MSRKRLPFNKGAGMMRYSRRAKRLECFNPGHVLSFNAAAISSAWLRYWRRMGLQSPSHQFHQGCWLK